MRVEEKLGEKKCERRYLMRIGFITHELRVIHWGCKFPSTATRRLHNPTVLKHREIYS